MSLYRACRFRSLNSFSPSITAVRFKKQPKRKPTWLPMAPCKVFRIPQHPYVPPDEKQLIADLLEEYTVKMESIRKVFQEEAKENADNVENIRKVKEKEEEEFRLLLAENLKENERIRVIREQTLEKKFQENLLQMMQMAEKKSQEMAQRILEIEDIVRKEKEKASKYITLENLDTAIENAINNPLNFGYCLSVDGHVTWEGKPSSEYELEIQARIAKGLKS